MLELLQPTAGDTLIALMSAFRADPRPDKIDVGIGIYRNEEGRTPIMAAVKTAEQLLVGEQDTKSYVGVAGDPIFNAAMLKLVLGSTAPSLEGRVRSVQTTGGCGALRSLLDLVALAKPEATVWVSDPTWFNHIPLVKSARLKLATYPYFDKATQSVHFDAMVERLSQLGPDDIVLLHGACHNPTGADLSEAQWLHIAELATRYGFLPFIDLAYQGLGQAVEADAFGVRCMAARVPELLIAVSCSKNFGLYRERVGCAMLLEEQSKAAQVAVDNLLVVLRGNYSMPPDHGAAVVARVLGDPSLHKIWQEELIAMRGRIFDLRTAVCNGFRQSLGSDKFDYISGQKGMFSLLGLMPEQVMILREKYGVYLHGDSRTNIAGLQFSQVDRFVESVVASCR
jgi:aspartate aminotransferase